jgi:hypothetical protein
MLTVEKRILPRNRLVLIGLAAALVVASLLVFLLGLPGHSHDPAEPGVILITPRDGTTLVLLHRFTWYRIGQPAVYHFFLYEVNRTLVWSTLVKDSSLILPSTVPLQRGQTYLWRVEAILPDEKTIHSDLRAFSLSQ